MGWLVVFGQLIAFALLGLVTKRCWAGIPLGCSAGALAGFVALSNALLSAPLLALALTLGGAVSVFASVNENRRTVMPP